MANTPTQSLLTEAELELMLILWELSEGTVRDVLAALPKDRNMAYTTASTIIRILEKKGFVSSRKEGKAHIYMPAMNKDEYEANTLNHMLGKLFQDAPVSLVARLIDSKNLSQEEISEIKALLNKSQQKK